MRHSAQLLKAIKVLLLWVSLLGFPVTCIFPPRPTVASRSTLDIARQTMIPLDKNLLPPTRRQDTHWSPPPFPPTPSLNQHHKHQLHSDNLHSFSARPSPSATVHDQVTTIFVDITTIIIMASPDPNKVFHDMDNDTYAHQQQQNGDSNNNNSNNNNNNSGSDNDDPNDFSGTNADLAKQLKDDQEALRRMVTILSLVGSFGFIAVVATVVIFARMRLRKKAKAEEEQIAAEDLEDEHRDQGTDGIGVGVGVGIGAGVGKGSGRSDHDSDDDDGTPFMPIPSAPPAPMLIEIHQQHQNHYHEHSIDDMCLPSSSTLSPPPDRRLLSVHSQTALAPSAPPAKELADQPEQGCRHRGDGLSVEHGSSKPLPDSTPCPNCHHHATVSEIPPPAYTPSAPPMYAVPDSP
ncbi:hypothetical protein J3Q64DRAFT_1746958 [Phycomyces blakesleeanus]|uniref:Mid2 domain-containing protein n=2 Tax=Phycomyces blakesleeanus TaxID=4837 RepID=A0A163DMI4_PHYB8|nr:hypothetical protein PHYBLDRAFT_146546 [Phycomyces blakesleeanus NRRL 1555(-)]OAD72350.1 hypothetical protein PHYBLDRAFT_146546 [Phycomyces blakesleeanus NRRL 1555(-)]|eukprot:XP_018290390.1 hypothetical protein PHYBLDRAFT_146546 [Phycomyces blakesleeanus NRRL 1555(-)]